MKMTRFGMMALVMMMALSQGACGDHDHDHDNNDHGHGQNEEAEFCAHMVDGPNKNVTASVDASGALTEAWADHTRVDVAMPGAGASEATAYVSFTPEAAGDVEIALGVDVPFEVLDGTTAVAAERTTTNGTCPQAIVKGYVYELEAKSYTIKIGPTTEATVSLVAEAAGEHDHD